MRYVQISTHADGWGRTLLFEKHKELQSQGHESYVFWARGAHSQDECMKKIAWYPESCLDAILTRFDGKAGFHSRYQTKRLLERLDKIAPDYVHLHVLIGYYLNVEMLFDWLVEHDCQVIWTMHDCWAFTGHCIHFTQIGCNQWLTGCAKCRACPSIDSYPKTFSAKSVLWNYEEKRRIFTSLPADRMTLVAPSQWLANNLRRSFLSKYDVVVVPNEIDRSIFKPTEGSFRSRYGIEDIFTVLAVSNGWSEKKGIDDIERLSSDLSGDVALVVVGLNAKQIKKMRKKIIAGRDTRLGSKLILLPKTDSVEELVELYSAADIFFNPTKEDTYPTVNLEAEACGTPVITYDAGGCCETIGRDDSLCVRDYEEAFFHITALASDYSAERSDTLKLEHDPA